MSYACEQANPREVLMCEIQKIGDNPTKVHTVSGAECEASDERHRIHDSEAQAVASTQVCWNKLHGCANQSFP